VPEVTKVGRRTGRAELDEHAEGVHYTEMDVDLKASDRSRERDHRRHPQRLAAAGGQQRRPADLAPARPPALRRARPDRAEDLRRRPRHAARPGRRLRERLAKIPGVTDLQIEKQVLIPQVKIRLDYEQAARYGVAPGNLLRSLEQMIEGERITQIIEGNRRFDLLVRLPEAARGPQALANLLIETPSGHVPLSKVASVEESDGPNQVSRENSRRRIVLSANTDGRDMSQVIADIRAELAAKPCPRATSPRSKGSSRRRSRPRA
jgi:HME family heavy-metal exporter